jgi:xylulokinase
MFDVRTHDWDDRILDRVGIPRDRLARPLPSGAVVGTIPPGVARHLALPDGVSVVTGGHDQVCAALGAGVTVEGRAMYATGTVECICPAFDEACFTDRLFRSNLCTYDHAVEGMYATVAFSLTGGNLLKWFRDEWAPREVQQAAATGTDPYDLLMAMMPAEPTRLLALPYFTPSGTPHFDADTPGALLGLRLTTTRGEVLRGLLEGVAFEMRLNLDIIEESGVLIGELIASGGGAKSRVLTQLKADVIGKPVHTLTVTETGCFGAALLARAAHTGTPVRELADRLVARADCVEPDPDRAAFYTERFAAYRRIYPALRSIQEFQNTLSNTPAKTSAATEASSPA